MREQPETDPLVSVIIPSFNHARYIEQTILSVLAQTYPAFQLVVIDDGSSDGSVEMLKALAGRHKFDLICQANGGVCRALNRAIRDAAKGTYIALLGSDDLWHRDKLRLQIEALDEAADAEFCFSQARQFGDGIPPARGRVFPRRCHRGSIVRRVFLRQHVPAGTILFSRRLYDELGGFDETLLEEDWDFVIRSAAATRFAAVDRPLLEYRIHAASTMRTRNGAAIFHQKAKILAKNFSLVSPFVWLAAIVLHFFHDIVMHRMRR